MKKIILIFICIFGILQAENLRKELNYLEYEAKAFKLNKKRL